MLKKIIFVFIGSFVLTLSARAGEFSISGFVKWYSGKYMYQDITNTTYFYPTLSYRTDKYFVSVNLPLISQSSDMITHMGGSGIIPSLDNYGDNSFDESHEYGMFSGDHMDGHGMNWAIGDLYINVERTLLKEKGLIPGFSVTALLKLPTASTEQNLGTGEVDYGFGISASKDLGLFYGFWDVNYYFLGDPVGFDLNDPIGFGLGLGLPASNHRLSLLAYYSGYTEILQNIEPPRELSISVSYKWNQKYLLNSGISYGFSESSPKYGFFFGADVSL